MKRERACGFAGEGDEVTNGLALNPDQIRLLHGLYFSRENIEEVRVYVREQLAWLIVNPVPLARHWIDDDGRPRVHGARGIEPWRRVGDALQPLLEADLIHYREIGPEIHVAVTRLGAEVAIEHHNRMFSQFLTRRASRRMRAAQAVHSSTTLSRKRSS
jgi:hypothetical protein